MSKYIPPCRSLERIACELMEPYRSDAEFCSKCPKRMVEVPKPTFAVPDGSSDAFTMAGEMAKIEEILEDMMLENDTLSSSSSSSSNKILVKSCTYSRELLLSVNQRLLLKGMGDLECPKTKTPKLIGELIDVTKINWIRTRKPKIAEHERANLSASDGNICRGPSRQPRVAFSESQPHLLGKKNKAVDWRSGSNSSFNGSETSWRQKPMQSLNIHELRSRNALSRPDHVEASSFKAVDWRMPEVRMKKN